jgi:antitoxin component YwqK of YwqJK toxin-antitoxin module
VQEEGWHQDGMLQGTWLTYDELGNLEYRSEYLNNDLHGNKEEFFPGGKINNLSKNEYGWLNEFIQYDTTGKEINRCKIDKGNGKFKVVFFNGKTFGEGTYVDGELHGLYKFSYFDGSTNTNKFYKRGEIDSLYQNYYYGGQLSMQGSYKNGKREGQWKSYFVSGKLNYIEQYQDGELTGKKIYYFENGKPDTEIELDNGDREGWTKKFDEDGSLLYQVRYVKDLPVAYTYMDKTGKLVPEVSIPGGSGSVKPFFANGIPSADMAYADGKLHGPNILYHPNGKIRSQSIEDYGLSEGSYKYFFASGQIKYEYIFLHDNLHGLYKEYNEKGIVVEEGEYYNGQPHHTIKKYDDAGKLKETRIYYYGKLLDVKK